MRYKHEINRQELRYNNLQLRTSSKNRSPPDRELQSRDPRLCDRKLQEQLLSSSTTFLSGMVRNTRCVCVKVDTDRGTWDESNVVTKCLTLIGKI